MSSCAFSLNWIILISKYIKFFVWLIDSHIAGASYYYCVKCKEMLWYNLFMSVLSFSTWGIPRKIHWYYLFISLYFLSVHKESFENPLILFTFFTFSFLSVHGKSLGRILSRFRQTTAAFWKAHSAAVAGTAKLLRKPRGSWTARPGEAMCQLPRLRCQATNRHLWSSWQSSGQHVSNTRD